MLRRRFISLPLAAGLCTAATGATAGGDAPAVAGVGPRRLVFPADFGAHPQTRIEWWYLTGALGVAGQPQPQPAFGFQITFFRSRTGVPADHPSRFAASQLVLAHVAVSSVQRRELRHDQDAARSGFGIGQFSTVDTAVSLRHWRLHRDGPVDASRYRAQAASSDARFAFDLQFSAARAPLLQGDAGWSQKGPQPENASHYYSQPQLAASGRMRIDGSTWSVDGRGWLDHEWSDSLLPPQAVGWDWIGINLDDGSALTAFRLRRADGSTLHAGGSWRPAGGNGSSFAASDVAFVAARRWRSPHTQAEYPVVWLVSTPAGTFRVEALFDDQELDSRRSTGAVYWEGLSRLSDRAGRVLGHGYLEMTGYAAPLQI